MVKKKQQHLINQHLSSKRKKCMISAATVLNLKLLSSAYIRCLVVEHCLVVTMVTSVLKGA